MKIKELTKEQVAQMLIDKGDKVELFVRKPIFCEEWILRDISYVCFVGSPYNGYYDRAGIIEEPKQRFMTRFEMIFKAMELHKENEESILGLWLISSSGFNPKLPMAIGFTLTPEEYTYTKYNQKGEKLTEDFQFIVEE